MYPLNGPSWSLFFEYIGNVLYALFIRKLPTRALSVLVLLAGCGLAAFAVWGPLGDICVGFAMDGDNMGSAALCACCSPSRPDCCFRVCSSPCGFGARSGSAPWRS